MAGSQKKVWHVHACRRCRIRYVDTCRQPGEDDICTGCRGGRPWQLLIDNAAPHTCCIAARLVTKDERERYRLAGSCNWHICPTCKRTHTHKIKPEDITQ